MARVVTTYDGVSIQTSTIVVERFLHESVDYKQLDVPNLGRMDGGKLINVRFQPRVIRLEGTIKGSTQAVLEANIDAFKALVNRQQKNLDMGYAGGTRRYITTSSRFTLERMHFNLTYADWSAEFVVAGPLPFGRSIDTATFTNTVLATGTYDGTATFGGSARPFPIIKVTVVSQTNMTQIQFRNKNTGDFIRIRRTFANSDVILIDTENYICTVNGVAVDYEGFFPDFVEGANDYAIRPVASAVSLTVKQIYRKLYL